MDDESLVRRTLEGDSSAYGELVRRWTAVVVALCHAHTADAQAAEELAQETLIRGWEELSSLPDPSRFAPWLTNLAAVTCRNWLKHRPRLPATTEANDEQAMLFRLVESLPAEKRVVVMLHLYHHSTPEQIAKLLELTPATVQHRLKLDELSVSEDRLRAAFARRDPVIARLVTRLQESLANKRLRRSSLLVVDDDPHVLTTTSKLVESEFDVVTARSATEAEKILSTQTIHILLTDQRMPGKPGVQLLEWAREFSPRTIRLLMTGHSELDDAVEAINRGHVYYYLLKPFRTSDLLQILRNASDKYFLERKRERYLEELWELNRELELRVAARTRELEEANQLLEQKARELERLALTDPLTGMLNRRAIEELARFELKRHARYPSPLAIGYVDVDHFKDINTRYLYTGGDHVLRTLGALLAGTVREVDSVARVGGEEFLVLAREANAEGARVLAERLRTRVEATTISYKGQEIKLTISLGFAVAEAGVPTDYVQMTELAAKALASAKEAGRNRWEILCVPHLPIE